VIYLRFIVMGKTAEKLAMSAEEYLQFQRDSDVKYQFIDDQVYAMAGGSEEHNIISLNMAAELRHALKGSNCTPFIADMMVKAGGNYFYPDVSVICEPDDKDDRYLKHAPTLIAEVLSKSTRRIDLGKKKLAFINIPSLQEYVLIEQDKCEIEVFRRKDNWASTYYFLGDQITFESIDVTLTVEDIYAGINNADITKYLKQMSEQAAN